MSDKSKEKTMQDSIKAVLQLSKEDRLVQSSHKLLNSFPDKKKHLQEPLLKVEHQILSYKIKIGTFSQQIAEREKLVLIEKEKIKLSEIKLQSVKNQKEYAASQKEIETVNKIIKRVEDQILELEGQKEPVEEKLNTITSEYTEEKEILDKKLEKLDEEESTVKEKIGTYNTLKKELISKIDADLLRKYEKLSQRKIIPSAIEISAPNCQGCAIAIPAQLFNEIIQFSNGVCPHCGRLMFYKKPEPVEEEPKAKKKKKRKTKATKKEK
jgi:predicted  nucleic acid-binding Zn-ribbon protein